MIEVTLQKGVVLDGNKLSTGSKILVPKGQISFVGKNTSDHTMIAFSGGPFKSLRVTETVSEVEDRYLGKAS